jgi:ribosomal protein L3 glutamine methyltransferase
LSEPQISQIRTLYERRIKNRTPVAYLINEAWFAGLPFYVDSRVLIPRSPIAELVKAKFKPWFKGKSVNSLLDLCTGSACIAIACAKEFPKTKVVASDLSPEALAVAKINVQKHNVSGQVQLLASDLFKVIPEQQFDIIVSNPPYVDARDLSTLPKEYCTEPQMALTGGKDGLILVDVILAQAKRYLSPNGILIVEVGNSIEALKKKYPHLPFQWVKFKNGEGEVFVLKASDLN